MEGIKRKGGVRKSVMFVNPEGERPWKKCSLERATDRAQNGTETYLPR